VTREKISARRPYISARAFHAIAAAEREKQTALVKALEGMLAHFGHPRPQDYLSDDAYRDAIRKVADARAALALAQGAKT
jgi:hypothetical protein